MSKSWNRSHRELILLAVALLAASCGGHARPRVAGYYLVYSRGYQTTDEPPVVLARADGTGAHTIAHGEHPAVSLDSGAAGDWSFTPDGRWVVYAAPDTGCESESDLFAVPAAGGRRHVITHGAYDDSPVAWKHWIAFYRQGCHGGPIGIWRVRPDGSGLQRALVAWHPGRNGIWGFFPIASAPDDHALLGQTATPDAWDVGIRSDAATGRFSHVHGYPIGLSRDGRFALVVIGRGGRHQKIVALPFGYRGRPLVLARGEVCCPSWNR